MPGTSRRGVAAPAALALLACSAAMAAEPLSVLSEHKAIVDGRARSYFLFVPEGAGAEPTPLVIALHGGGGRGRSMEKLAHWSKVAAGHGFVVVYPDGIDRHWNDGRNIESYEAQRENIDDVAFVAALVDEVDRKVKVDRARVYVTGHSNGGLMSHRIACEAPLLIAAMAPVEGVITEATANACPPDGAPVPMMLIKGAAAPVFEKGSKRLTAEGTAKFWAARNGCAVEPTVSYLPDADPDDGTRTRRVAYGGCRDGADVVWLDVEGGGHTWPGGLPNQPDERVGPTSTDFDASEAIWEFFRAHHR